MGLWLVDDGCADGTSSVVCALWPTVHLLKGDGNLFWCGGMRLAWKRAASEEPQFLLLLNDDVELEHLALSVLSGVWESEAAKGRPDTIVVGSCRDPETGAHTYGGQARAGRHPGRLRLVPPADLPVACHTFHGNLVLIPREVYERVGELSPFRHALADTDYGYRAAKAGCRLLVAPGFLARCARSVAPDAWRNSALPRRERLRRLLGPKGLPPADWALFLRRHAGPEWPLYWCWTYLRAFLGA